MIRTDTTITVHLDGIVRYTAFVTINGVKLDYDDSVLRTYE